MAIKTITVGELITQLKNFPPETKVALGYTYPDHWHTHVVEAIDDYSLEFKDVKYSEYHDRFKVVEEETKESEYILLITNVS